jgi:hypothetical protein
MALSIGTQGDGWCSRVQNAGEQRRFKETFKQLLLQNIDIARKMVEVGNGLHGRVDPEKGIDAGETLQSADQGGRRS